MRSVRVVLMLIVLFCLTGRPHAILQNGKPYLVTIPRTDPAVTSFLQDQKIPVCFQTDAWYFAQAGEADLERFEAAGLAWDIIDDEAWSESYFFITKLRGEDLGEIPHLGNVLFRTEKEALVKAGLRQALEFAEAGFQLTRIFPNALPLREDQIEKDERIKDKLRFQSRTDDVIGAIVNQVSLEIVQSYVQRLQDFRTRFFASDSIWAAGQWLYDRFVEFGYTDVVFDNFVESEYGVPVRNVIATKPGALYPDSVIIIGGHYDTIVYDASDYFVWAPGADDDASGVVGVLEAARILANVDLDCTVKFACWTAEEIGLYGAWHYATEAYDRRERIGLYINYDMLGNLDENDPSRNVTIYLNATAQAYADLMAEMATEYTSLVPEQFPAFTAGSDHAPFMLHGYNILYAQEGDFSPYIHTGFDVTDNMNFPYMCEVVKMGLGTLAAVAGPPASISVTEPVITLESYDIDDDAQGGSIGNGNGYLDTGETIEVTIALYNYSDSDAHGVRARLVTDDAYVSIVHDEISFGDIPSDGMGSSHDQFLFVISEDCPVGHFLDFSVEVTTTDGFGWMSYFTERVVQPSILYVTFSIEDTDGNGNGAADPGETVDMYLLMGNGGLRSTSGTVIELATEDPDVTIIDNEIMFPDMDIGTVAENTDDAFVFSLDEAADVHTVPFTLHISEGQGYYQISIPFYVLIKQGTVRLVDDDGGTDKLYFYLEALQLAGVPYDIEHINGLAMPHSDDLDDYSEVLWYTGTVETNTLTTDEQSDIEAFLNGGGRLLLSGSMIGYEIGDSPFYRNYLHGDYVSFLTLLHHLNGVPSNPVVGDMDITLATTGLCAQGFAGETDPISPAGSIFDYDRSTQEGPGTVRSSGSGALAVETSVHKLVYVSFGVEGIVPVEDMAQVLADVLAWFKEPGVDKGDVDGNGSTDIIDAVVAVNIVLGMHQPDEGQRARADMNYDGSIDIIDVVKVVNAVLGSSGKVSAIGSKDM
ncbi:MAG: M20/M25/M40 family metallo-hydrolase [Gemmatimonadota bacterium]|nr:MAG: M20/M25/M40 family metallo-hydrolase [Gemmatimonadota bacterium]